MVLPPICILAGGRGTRLGERVRNTPKPLLEVAGEPFLHHQLRLLASHGARQVVLCVGYLGERVKEAIGPERFGIEIRYSDDGPSPAGTLGAVRKAAPLLGDRFLILYGDTYLRLDYLAAAQAWERSGLSGLMTVLHNENRLQPSNAMFDGKRVHLYDKHRLSPRMDWIDYGLGGLLPGALGTVGSDVNDLADLYRELARAGELFGFEATKRFYDIGTPIALQDTEAFLSRRVQG